MKQASTNTVKCATKLAGALAPMNQKRIAAIRKMIAVARAEAGALASPWPWAFCGTGFAAAAVLPVAAAGGAAESLGGGGGQVILPSLITVVPRITSSSMLTLMFPSFALHSSSVRRSRLVAYSVLDCLASRLGRSV